MAQAPNLYGYVVTYGKPAAEMLLLTPKSDPLLAVQRYGLGRTAAFTKISPRVGGKTGCSGPSSASLPRS